MKRKDINLKTNLKTLQSLPASEIRAKLDLYLFLSRCDFISFSSNSQHFIHVISLSSLSLFPQSQRTKIEKVVQLELQVDFKIADNNFFPCKSSKCSSSESPSFTFCHDLMKIFCFLRKKCYFICWLCGGRHSSCLQSH